MMRRLHRIALSVARVVAVFVFTAFVRNVAAVTGSKRDSGAVQWSVVLS